MQSIQNHFFEIKNLSKAFSENLALDQVELEIKAGEVHALLGENGAGKSTLIKIILGVLERNSGDIYLNGRKVEYKSPRDAYHDGIAGIFQENSLVSKLSILENVFLGAEITGPFGVLDNARMQNCFIEVCQKMRLTLDPTRLVNNLTVAEQKLVEIIKSKKESSVCHTAQQSNTIISTQINNIQYLREAEVP